MATYKSIRAKRAKQWFTDKFQVVSCFGKPALISVGRGKPTPNFIELQWRGDHKRATEYTVMQSSGDFETGIEYGDHDLAFNITKKQLAQILGQVNS